MDKDLVKTIFISVLVSVVASVLVSFITSYLTTKDEENPQHVGLTAEQIAIRQASGWGE